MCTKVSVVYCTAVHGFVVGSFMASSIWSTSW